VLFVVVLFWASSQLIRIGTFNTGADQGEGKPGMGRERGLNHGLGILKRKNPKRGSKKREGRRFFFSSSSSLTV